MNLDLHGKVVLVTGGASGIGEAIARTVDQEQGHVAIVDRDASRGQRVASELNSGLFLETDLSQPEACQRAVEATVAKWQRLDIVVNNAGINDAVGLDRAPADFADSVQRNLVHYYSMVHYATPHLREHRGAIVNIGSKVSETGQGGTSGYAAAKGAINALTREWAVDFASDGVRVNTVVPAEVWTPMYERWLASQPDGLAEKRRIEERIPLENRFTTAQEIANAVVFLASSAASHITGQIIHVDGGYVHLDRRYTAD